MLHPAIVAMAVEMRATAPTLCEAATRAAAATEMPEADAVVAMARMQGTLVTAGTLTILKQAATSRRVAPTPSAVVVVVVAGQDRKPRHAPRAVHPARHRCQISTKAMGALRGGEAQHRSHARVSDLEH